MSLYHTADCGHSVQYGDKCLTCYMDAKDKRITQLEAELQEKGDAAIEEVAQYIEDDRYHLSENETGWSRFIARKIRTMKEPK